MNSPPTPAGKPFLHQEPSDQDFTTHLTQGLEKAVEERNDAAHEPEFDNDESEEKHKHPCEQLHKHFSPHLLGRYRWRASTSLYTGSMKPRTTKI